MKKFLLPVLIFVVAALVYVLNTRVTHSPTTAAAPNAVPQATVEKLLESIRGVLPAGWRVGYNKRDSWLEVSRDGEVEGSRTVINGTFDVFGEKAKELHRFSLFLRVVPFVPPARHRELLSENVATEKNVNALYAELERMRMNRKFDSFSPKTEEQRSAVAHYEALKKSHHKLPDFYFGDVSLEWTFVTPNGPSALYVDDERIREECASVQEKLTKLFFTYEEL